jgi:hypothetical protein
MRTPRALPVVDYNPYSLPPRTYWQVGVDIPRNAVGTFCERLHLRTAERFGASLFVPDTANGRNTCRFEWNREYEGDPFGLRLGLTFRVADGPLRELEGYVTTKNLVNATSGTVPTFDAALLDSVKNEVARTIEFAFDDGTAGPTTEWSVVFHISVPYGVGFSESADAAGGRFRLLKTRIVPKELTRLSALIVRCKARSLQAAQIQASREAMVVLALLTLSERRKYDLATLQWPRSWNFKNVFLSSRPTPERRLFPPRRYVDGLEAMDASVISRFEEVWAAYEGLAESDRKLFTPALLAYYSAMNTSTNAATISTVGYMASLSALSQPLRRKCGGQLTCSVHGALGWQHDEVSETNAITETILTTCGIDRADQRADIKLLVQRVYREQRSAFVHSAELRHAEYGQGSQAAALPSNEGPTSELFAYQEDLMSIGGVTRRTLIEWVVSKSGRVLDRAKMQISTERVTYRSTLSAVASVDLKS